MTYNHERAKVICPEAAAEVERLRWELEKERADGDAVDIEMGAGDILIGDLKGKDSAGVIFYRADSSFPVGHRHPEKAGVTCTEIEGRIFSVMTSNLGSLMVLRNAVDRAIEHAASLRQADSDEAE